MIVALLLTAPACSGTAYIVQADGRGGEVALEGSYFDRIAEARALMAEHCHGRFTVQDEDGSELDVPTRAQSQVRFECVRPRPTQLASAH